MPLFYASDSYFSALCRNQTALNVFTCLILLLLSSFSSVKNELIPSHQLELSEKNVSNLNYSASLHYYQVMVFHSFCE